MEKLLFVASYGAMAPALVLLHLNDKHFVRALPPQCNFLVDTMLTPRADAIHDHLACMGTVGREMYADFYLFDLVLFPLIYSVNLSGLLRRAWPTAPPLLWALPFVAALADLGENACMSLLLAEFPAQNAQAQLAVSWLTPTKWMTVAICVALVAVGGAWRLLQWATGASQPAKHAKTT